MKVAVTGGGAAGFFGAITVKEFNPDAEVCILEKSGRLLSKVKISGGGRCNVTNATFDIKELVKRYPRGSKELISVFTRFGPRETIEWFESKGVKLKTEKDNRVFPVTDDSQTIIDFFLKQAADKNIQIKGYHTVQEIRKKDDGFTISFKEGKEFYCNKILVAQGGNSKSEAYDWMRETGHTIIEPAPSLYSLKFAFDYFEGLEGISLNNAGLSAMGKKNLSVTGPIVLTHKGISGPAVLHLSALGAREFNREEFSFDLYIDWVPDMRQDVLSDEFREIRKSIPGKKVLSNPCFGLPLRLWQRLMKLSLIIQDEQVWNNVNNDSILGLARFLKNFMYMTNGKSTNKEEFVTAGGVSLKDVNFRTMESKKCPGIYFAGEVLDIDGITGGFNFQSAWSTARIAGKSLGSEM